MDIDRKELRKRRSEVQLDNLYREFLDYIKRLEKEDVVECRFMNSYERLLIEMGEKSYVPQGSKWPVELRLLFLIIVNAVIFIIGRMVMRKTGSNMMNMFSKVNPPNPPRTSKKRKMKGPNIPEFEQDV